MGIKTKIKNDLWRINYVVPFAKKHLNDSVGKATKLKRIVGVASGKRVSKAKGARSVGADTLQLMQDIEIFAAPKAPFIYCIDERQTLAMPGNVLVNFPLDYNQIVNCCIDDLFNNAAGDAADEFGKEATYIKKALHCLRDRMLAAVQDAGDGAWSRISALQTLFEVPATSFHAGLQRVLFFNQVMWQTRHRLNGLARLDKTLGSLYEKDLANGTITEKDAALLIDAFLSCLHTHYEFKSDALFGDIGQIIILGGLEPDGTYFRNGLTDLFLERQAAMGYPDPKTFLRVSRNMPQDLMVTAVKALASSTGSPLFSNDDVVIPALLQYGVDEEDAYGYCVSACWEPLVPGKSLGQNNMAVFDACAPLMEIIAEANNLMRYEDIMKLYEGRLAEAFGSFLLTLDDYKWAKDPLVSLFYPECVETRTDISEGGSKYKNYGITMVGMANAVNTLSNLEMLLKRGDITLGRIQKAVASNFENDGRLLEECRVLNPFGHDSDETVGLTNRLMGILDGVANSYTNPLGGKVKFGLSSPDYIKGGAKAPADLTGRKDGDPYYVHISNADSAYTELVQFAAGIEYTGHRINGNVVDFFVNPSLLTEQTEKFADFLIMSVSLGFYQMQMNVMDSATLIDAKAHPEQYPGLIVRVWGFSAYFNDLPENYKDYLIERARASESA